MDVTNLSRVFGPTLVGHGVPDPDPMTILQDTKRQPRVEPGYNLSFIVFMFKGPICRILGLSFSKNCLYLICKEFIIMFIGMCIQN